MTDPANYEEAIVETLRRRAVQSAILIDDQFPSYSDLLDADGAEAVRQAFRDVDDARRLYGLMHENRIVCDVENKVGDVTPEFIEKIRKSDLVVLDWNLNPVDNADSEGAVKVICGLSSSPHFNLVAIYTRDKLDDVWTRSAVRLRGGWREKEDLPLGEEFGGRDLDEVVQDLDPDGSVELVTDGMLREYVVGGLSAVASRKTLEQEIGERVGVPRAIGEQLLEILLHRAARARHGAEMDGSDARRIEGSCGAEICYLNAGSVFVCLVSKPGDPVQDTGTIFDHLDRALVKWRPSVLQLLVSELQNELEHHSYAFDHSRMPTDLLKAGWMFHMLQEHAEGTPVSELVAGLNLRLTEAIEESVRGRLADPQSSLSRFGRLAAGFAVAQAGDLTGKPELELVERACGIAGLPFSSGKGTEHKVLHALNEYLSLDPFRGGHVTVGTILCSADRGEWWMCVSPACDMVPREPRDKFSWQADVQPLRPMHLLKLQISSKTALEDAEQGGAVFVTVEGQIYFLRATDKLTRLPRPTTCMLDPQPLQGGDPWQRHGFAFHEMRPHEGGVRTERREVFAVSQMRPAYAARFQHLAGGHQSRIGVDFVSFGKKAQAQAAA